MSFLADMGVADQTVAALRATGHDVVHAREIGFRSKPDGEILDEARSQARIAVTFDLDFGDLLAASGDALPSVILIRTQNQRPTAVTPRVLDVVGRFAPELQVGVLIVVEDAEFRIRRLPLH